MTEEQLDRIEEVMGRPLPDSYRTLMATPPTRVARDDVARAIAPRLLDDPDEILEATRSPLNEFYDRSTWLPTYLSIGWSGSGDQYLIDLSRGPSPVFGLSHETHQIQVEFPDLAAYVEDLKADMAGLEALFDAPETPAVVAILEVAGPSNRPRPADSASRPCPILLAFPGGSAFTDRDEACRDRR